MNLKLAVIALLATSVSVMPAMAQDGSTVLDGIYTAAQADRGKTVYTSNCEVCHAADLSGTPGGPGVAGPAFGFKWGGKTVGEFFTYIKTNMPAGSPGTLTDEQYADVTAYILSANNYPTSESEELGTDVEALSTIEIVRQ